uniref:Agenet domain-containing protein n=1 Tax=Davidia involucrata TaxID=16924 RepID=A0A5B7BPI8_DAVIN
MRMGIFVGNYVEICSREDGFLGSYYVAKVVGRVGKGKLMVEYLSLLDDDGKELLKEEVEVAEVRPVPPLIRVSASAGFNVLDKVDAFDNDGWWVGRVTGRRDASNYYVYFDSSGDEFTYPISRLRLHQEYENGHWVPSNSHQKGVNLERDFNQIDDKSCSSSLDAIH